jgi:hypothetical protein
MMMLTMCIAPFCGGGMVLGSGVFVKFVGFEQRQKSPPARLQACVSDKIQRIAVYMEIHFTGNVADGGIRLRRCIVE